MTTPNNDRSAIVTPDPAPDTTALPRTSGDGTAVSTTDEPVQETDEPSITTLVVTTTDSGTTTETYSNEPTSEPSSEETPTVTPSPIMTDPPLPAFECDPYGYLIQSKALYQVDLASGEEALVRDPVLDGIRNINALAYYPQENILY